VDRTHRDLLAELADATAEDFCDKRSIATCRWRKPGWDWLYWRS